MLKTDVHIFDRSRQVSTLARLEALMAPVKVLKRPRQPHENGAGK